MHCYILLKRQNRVGALFYFIIVTLYAAAVSVRGQDVRQHFGKYTAFKIKSWITTDETDSPHYLFKTLNALWVTCMAFSGSDLGFKSVGKKQTGCHGGRKTVLGKVKGNKSDPDNTEQHRLLSITA